MQVPTDSPIVLSARGISAGYRQAGRTIEVLSTVDLDVHAGEFVGLIGPNGAGKSTLLSVLSGLHKPLSGQVSLHGADLHTLTTRERTRSIGWLEQAAPIHWPISVERLVALGRLPHLGAWQRPSERDQAIIAAALDATDCGPLAARNATTLSGGERTRAQLARILAAEPTVILADEPVAALDLGHQLQTMALLRAFSREQRACVTVLHDLSLAARYCDRLYLVHEGRPIASGPPDAVLTAERLRDVYGVEVLRGHDEIPWIVPLHRVDERKAPPA